MNFDQLEGKWKQLQGKVREQFGKLTDDDIHTINGRRDILIGKLQERYGYAKEEAQRRADDWMKTFEEPEYAHSGSGTTPPKNPPPSSR